MQVADLFPGVKQKRVVDPSRVVSLLGAVILTRCICPNTICLLAPSWSAGQSHTYNMSYCKLVQLGDLPYLFDDIFTVSVILQSKLMKVD